KGGAKPPAEKPAPKKPIRVLLLDDREENLLLRSTILRRNGYEVVSSSSVRAERPHVPIIILSATLERRFGGIADMHLLKGYSSVDDLLMALRNFEAKRRGRPVVVDARDFYYSRIAMAMGDDVVLEILDRDGNWQYVNDYFAGLFDQKRPWFMGRNMFESF